MERGFASYIKKVAESLRKGMGCSQFVKLDPWAACDWLGIPVTPLTSLTKCPAVVSYFAGDAQAEFSAITAFDGPRRFIVYNDHHHPNRQASSLAHELGHALLQHPPAPILTDEGFRHWDSEIEQQAAFFSGVLLVPDEACRWILKQGATLAAASQIYGVSEPMIDYRLNMSGARKIHRRALARKA